MRPWLVNCGAAQVYPGRRVRLLAGVSRQKKTLPCFLGPSVLFSAWPTLSIAFLLLWFHRAFCVGSDIDIRVLKGYSVAYLNPHLQHPPEGKTRSPTEEETRRGRRRREEHGDGLVCL